MKEILVECNPDECLVKKLGFSKKLITHSYSKGNIYNKISKKSNIIAIVDEDPLSAKPGYHKNLIFVQENFGIKHYRDNSNNNIFELKVKLEDWIIDVCKKLRIEPDRFGLPNEANRLHNEINSKLDKFAQLIDKLIEIENSAIITLKEWLNNTK